MAKMISKSVYVQLMADYLIENEEYLVGKFGALAYIHRVARVRRLGAKYFGA